MAVTGTGTLSNSVVAAHLQTDFLVATASEDRWDQFCWVPTNGAIAPASSDTATSVQIVVYKNMDLSTSTIAEDTDIEGTQLGDTTIDLSVGEYGDTAQDTKKLRALARTDIPKVFQISVGRGAGRSIDMLARTAFLGGSVYRRPTAGDTRADLDLTNDDMQAAGYHFMYSLVAQLRSVSAPGIGQSGEEVTQRQGASEPGTEYVSIVHDLAIGDLQETNGWTPLSYVQSPQLQGLYNGELAKLAGVRFIESPLGKIYQAGGTKDQAASSLGSASTAGATSIVTVAGTGIIAGDYVTVGTPETANTDTTTLETAFVTSAQSTHTLHIIGAGAGGGMRYAHAAAAPSCEGTFVAAIPVFGGMSVAKAHSTVCGPKPTMVTTGPFDKLGRFVNYGWWWLGGYGRTIPTWIVRGEVAVNGKAIMAYGA